MATLREREKFTEQDMADLLAIYEAQEALQGVVESLIGEMVGCGWTRRGYLRRFGPCLRHYKETLSAAYK